MRKSLVRVVTRSIVAAGLLLAALAPLRAQTFQLGAPPDGMPVAHSSSAATTNSTLIAAVSGAQNRVLLGLQGVNTNSTDAYLKFYDKATAPTCNSDTVVATVRIKGSKGFNKLFPFGVNFKKGIGICITGGQGDTDNTNATTGITLDIAYR